MERRTLGSSNIKISPICLGGNVFGWTVDEAKAFKIMDEMVALGCNFIDTADVYSTWVPGNKGGESETIIGKWMKLRGNREKIVIATKVGKAMSQDKKGLTKKYILNAVEESLKRLQSDYIDLYQSHDDDPNTPLEETLSAYALLFREGKLREVGASNYNAQRLLKALQVSKQYGYPRYQSLQTLYNLYDRDEYEKQLESTCVENHLGVLSYFSLASGFLTGKYRSEIDLAKSPRGSTVKRYLNKRGLRILTALDNVAKQYHSDLATVALAWLFTHQSITAVIASATNPQQLKTIVAATSLKLDKASVDVLNEASSNVGHAVL